MESVTSQDLFAMGLLTFALIHPPTGQPSPRATKHRAFTREASLSISGELPPSIASHCACLRTRHPPESIVSRG